MSKVILITGASSGIGKATALQLVKEGHTVYGAARRVDEMKDLESAGAARRLSRGGTTRHPESGGDAADGHGRQRRRDAAGARRRHPPGRAGHHPLHRPL